MAGGKPPPPPLSPHEEGENSNSKPSINQPHRQPHENESKNVIISSIIPSTSNGYTPKLSVSHKPTYSEVVKGPSPNPIHAQPLRPTAYNLDVSQTMLSDVTLMPISEFQGKPSVIFPISEKILLVDKLQFVLIGKFTHGRPTWTSILQFFEKLKLTGSYSISIYDKKHIFIECANKFDYYRIWMKLTWFIGVYAMRVFKWTSNFSPLVEAAIAPVWVRFEGLPLYMFDVLPLLSVSNCLGKPIRVDPRNVSRTIVNSARVCVELDISQPLVEEVWVNFEDEKTKKSVEGFWVKVFYDAVPAYCEFCSHIGHGMQSCKRRSEMVSMGDKRPENGRQFHSPDTACDQNGTTKQVCAPEVSVELVKTDQGLAGKGDAEQVCAVVVGHGKGELVGKKKDFRQLEGMLANKMLQSASISTSSRTSAYPKAQKTNQRQKKVYQAKNQLQLSSEALEITKNTFAILAEEVLIEDLSLEEGELVVADVCVPTAISSHLVHAATAVTASEPVAGETGPGLAFARDPSIGLESKRVDAGSQKPAAGKAFAVQKVPAGVSVTSGKAAAEEDIAAMVLDDILQEAVGLQDDLFPGEPAAESAAAGAEEEAKYVGHAGWMPEVGETAAMLDCTTAAGKPFVAELELSAMSHETSNISRYSEHISSAPQMKPLLPTSCSCDGAEQEECLQHNPLKHLVLQEHTILHSTDIVYTTKDDARLREQTTYSILQEPTNMGADLVETEYKEEQKAKTREPTSACVTEDTLELAGQQPVNHASVVHTMNKSSAQNEVVTIEDSTLEEGKLAVEDECVVTAGNSVTPHKLSSAAAEFTPKWAVLVEELVEGKKQSDPTNYDMDKLNERMRRLRGEPAAPILATSTWVPPSMSKHLARELKKSRKQHRSNQNWLDIEDYSDVESEEGEFDEMDGSQMLNGEAFLSDGMGDIPRPFKIKSAPNSPKGRNSSYDSSTYLLSRGGFF